MYNTQFQIITDITPARLAQVIELMTELPEFDQERSIAEFKQRLYGRDALLMLCFVEGELVGFKLGYSLDEQRFYSWLGGVLPDFRGIGLAQKMLSAQEQWAAEQGYKAIQIKTRNRFKAMLNLLIKNSYQVIDFTQVADDVSQYRLSLQKQLTDDVY
ncbi:GNAT family N-acetyltransferase [Shewanella sp. C32]|uniref:GNAT family N-acetyltransferase n=1 Tax=Shewanella electrica TaxID=515560 RepID=A0ABT2FM58_9GAMM|nr:GNAT family N-acetyltransferase [Shewanella electrica]MCH1925975.1 GNAT family N-acetyltransferase [Shewanella electrica]MCS4557418.1 GNAT family N-acetyltransferase [Shewanella electrica]